MLYLDTHEDETRAVKAGLMLAMSRYRDSIGKFVQGKPERLSIVEDQIARISRECAEAAKADPDTVDNEFRAYLASEVAVSDPEKQQVDQGSGDTPVNSEPEQPQDGFAKDDVKATEPVLEEEITGPDATADLNQDSQKSSSCERCSKHDAQEDSIFCEGCNKFVLGESEDDPEKTAAPLVQAQPCPYCGHMMQPNQAATQPGGATQQQCPNCGASVMSQPGQGTPGFTQPTGLGGGMYASKEAVDAPNPDEPVDEGAQSPAEESPSGQDLPPAVEEDSNGPAQVYTGIVEEMANNSAAAAWSTPGDQDIQDVADAYGLDPDDVRSNLKIVADFGDSLAVNGDPSGDPSTEGMTELDQFGGRIPTTEEEVDVDNAIEATSSRTNLPSDDLYTLIAESYGGDIGNRHHVSVSGEARYYLPQELVPQQQEPVQQSQPPAQDTDSPTELPDQAVSSSVKTRRFRSLAEFLEFDREQRLARA